MNKELVFAIIFLTILLGSCAVLDTLSSGDVQFTPDDYDESERWQDAPQR